MKLLPWLILIRIVFKFRKVLTFFAHIRVLIYFSGILKGPIYQLLLKHHFNFKQLGVRRDLVTGEQSIQLFWAVKMQTLQDPWCLHLLLWQNLIVSASYLIDWTKGNRPPFSAKENIWHYTCWKKYVSKFWNFFFLKLFQILQLILMFFLKLLFCGKSKFIFQEVFPNYHHSIQRSKIGRWNFQIN